MMQNSSPINQRSYPLDPPRVLPRCTNERRNALVAVIAFTVLGAVVGEVLVLLGRDLRQAHEPKDHIIRALMVFFGFSVGALIADHILHNYDNVDVRRRERNNILASTFFKLVENNLVDYRGNTRLALFIRKEIITPQEIQNLFIRDVRQSSQDLDSLSNYWFEFFINQYFTVFNRDLSYPQCPIFLRIKNIASDAWDKERQIGRANAEERNQLEIALIPLRAQLRELIHELRPIQLQLGPI